MGWLDEHGNFGRCAPSKATEAGKPDGAWVETNYIDKLCLKCNTIYTVVLGNPKKYPIKSQQTQEANTSPSIVIPGTPGGSESCPVCNDPLLNGRDLLDHVINRDRVGRFILSRLPSSESVKCPKCKSDFLRYDIKGNH